MGRVYRSFILFFSLLISSHLFSQTVPFSISLEPVSIDGLGGLQSFAVGQHKGKWLIAGGRLDGLHRRQPFASFNKEGFNNQLIVIDPMGLQKWTASVSMLPVSIQEQLQSTNMQFHQNGRYLYLLGGYGYSATEGTHTTFPFLTAIDVSRVIEAIINKKDFSSYIRQISDPQFQVTGGRLDQINDIYYLVGGQKFIGRYNPMGPDHGPGFLQEYTNQIRKFSIADNGAAIRIKHLPGFTDAENLHRRDYNVLPQILPTGEEGLTAFSGVFQQQEDMPFLNAVTINSKGYFVNNNFQQYYNHYHCANIPLYSASKNEMHNLFFGGIAQYYDSAGIRIRDDNVPFVKTIASVTRNANGIMTETKLPAEMPALLGAGSEFIPVESLPRYKNGVLKLDELTTTPTVIGYIYGGISSTAANIFWFNNGTQSAASSQIFKVNLTKN
ncbi:hypothetical protein [Lacibacter sp.]|uniref:hypothetical protein n=1 Tax=Lacibacter sp. TaxID=1915409 RepID=UPI002B4B9394|nr:hypothetical protein [Lacibacter sp.]HLP36382.1 hypothetical protein [Lacibacter sp.]